MAIKLQRASDLLGSHIKLLVYGWAGSGKTSLIPTLPSPVILNAESGLLSIKDADVPFVSINSLDDLSEAFLWLSNSEEAKQFETVALDSISEIGQVVLADHLKNSKDPRQAYGATATDLSSLVRAFRDLPKNVYFSAQAEKSQDETGKLLWSPAMPGNKISQQLPYFFDEVLALRIEKDADGLVQRALLTDSDGSWLAKDRSGKLNLWESPDLGAIINKIKGDHHE